MSTNPATIADALSRLWARFLPEIEIRVGLVAAAASALATGELTAEQRVQAHEAAHKLAGSLGTFGLHRGTELARRAELALAEEPVAATVAELASWVGQLQSLIRDRG